VSGDGPEHDIAFRVVPKWTGTETDHPVVPKWSGTERDLPRIGHNGTCVHVLTCRLLRPRDWIPAVFQKDGTLRVCRRRLDDDADSYVDGLACELRLRSSGSPVETVSANLGAESRINIGRNLVRAAPKEAEAPEEDTR